MSVTAFRQIWARGMAGALLVVAAAAPAADWPHWRGPHFNGTSDEKALPGSWDKGDILWSTPMAGPSSASPIVMGKRVFGVSNSDNMESLEAFCLDRDTGAFLWKKVFVEDVEQPRRNTMASPSPVSDGEKVYFTFGSGDIFATDFDGNVLWHKNLREAYGPINQQFGYSATPLPYNGNLYIVIMRGQWDRAQLDDFTDEDCYVICLDTRNGDQIWRTHRSSDGGDEAFDSYTSPMPYNYGGVNAIITQGANYLIAHDADTGKELWRQNHNPEKGRMWRLIPSPVAAGNLVIGVQPRGQSAFAVDPSVGTSIPYDKSHWIYEAKTTDVPTPIYHDGRVYLLNGVRKILFCLDAKSGEELWVGELEADSRVWSSPVLGDGKMYCQTEDGQVVTMAVGDQFEVLSRVSLGGKECKSTIAISDGKLFIRTSDAMVCVGTK